MKVYDENFNQNELFTIIILVIGLTAVIMFPKRFSMSRSLTFLMFGYFIGMWLDHTIGIKPHDFYDVNDNSSYQFSDSLTYLMYGPFSYFFVYFYEKWKIKRFSLIIYILGWVIIAFILELIGVYFGVYHYKNDYEIIFSIPIYLVVQSLLIIFYHLIKAK